MTSVLAEAVTNKNSITGLYISANENLDKYQLGMVRLESVRELSLLWLIITVKAAT